MNLSSKSAFILVVLVALQLSVQAQTPWPERLRDMSWLGPVRHLALLKSTKSDLANELGEPETFSFVGADFVKYYNTSYGRVIATYTTADCTNNVSEIIPMGVLDEISLEPGVKVTLASLKLPLSRFVKTRDNDAPSIETYTNKREGIAIEIQNGRITNITFKPPTRIGLTCGNP